MNTIPKAESSSAEKQRYDDEWEETTMVVKLNGVLDAQGLRESIEKGQFALRRAAAAEPILQIGPSLYLGKWEHQVGTDIILEADHDKSGTTLKMVSISDRELIGEKALITNPTMLSQRKTSATSWEVFQEEPVAHEDAAVNTDMTVPPNIEASRSEDKENTFWRDSALAKREKLDELQCVNEELQQKIDEQQTKLKKVEDLYTAFIGCLPNAEDARSSDDQEKEAAKE
ncbi:unnamed protein product, partial [Mesorhabditis spiculigera]